MKFVLNTSLDPHFCALFDEQNHLVDFLSWENRRKMGQFVWGFLEKNRLFEKKLAFVGGVSGPGGFSNLRGAAGIIDALSLKFELPVHQVRADRFVEKVLEKNDYQAARFLLNSFSDGVFYAEGGNLVRITIDEAVSRFEGQEVFVGFLPPEKQAKFLKKIALRLENQEEVLLELLEETEPQKQFIPAYEFPAV